MEAKLKDGIDNWHNWIKELADMIITDIHINDKEPMDGDETSLMGQLLTIELDYRCGNLTSLEYEETLAIKKKGDKNGKENRFYKSRFGLIKR